MLPERIERYEIISEIGQGAMAVIYLARDPLMDDTVAIKVLPRHLTLDSSFSIRFQREMDAIARLNHPNVVPIIDSGEENNQPYFVMRYMAGGTLADRIQNTTYSLEDSYRLLLQISPALDKAHALGIIHRDIKPGNILFDLEGTAYLSDFGIAKFIELTSSLTGPGSLGTPAYISPEVAQGNSPADGRSDIYALGILLFRIWSGELPFNAKSPLAVAMQHVLDPVPYILRYNPYLPPGIQELLEKALAKNPDDRFQTASELTPALCELLGSPQVN